MLTLNPVQCLGIVLFCSALLLTKSGIRTTRLFVSYFVNVRLRLEIATSLQFLLAPVVLTTRILLLDDEARFTRPLLH